MTKSDLQRMIRVVWPLLRGEFPFLRRTTVATYNNEWRSFEVCLIGPEYGIEGDRVRRYLRVGCRQQIDHDALYGRMRELAHKMGSELELVAWAPSTPRVSVWDRLRHPSV